MATTITDRLAATATSVSSPVPAYGFTGLAVLASAEEAELASAASVDLLGSDALLNRITGTATITSLGSAANRVKLARFTGAAVLTHASPELVLPGGANITTAAGDTMLVASDGDGNARVLFYQRADGTGLAGLDPATYDPAGVAEQLAGLTATQTLSGKTLTSPVLNGSLSGSAVLDEDDMASDSATAVATQQSIKAYVADYVSTHGAGGTAALDFGPLAAEFPSSNAAGLDTRNGHPVLDFDADTNETVRFTGRLPAGYGGGGLTVKLAYSMSSATSGDVDWDVAIERIGDQQLDVDADSFASAQSVDDTTVPATSGLVDVVTVTFADGSEMDNLAGGELFRLSVTRDAASDTAAGDAELHHVEIAETV